MSYSDEKRLLGVLIADHLSNLSERSNIIENNLYINRNKANVSKRRKKSGNTEIFTSDDDDLAAIMLGRVTQTEHCLMLYYRLLDMPGTVDACIDLLSTNSLCLKSFDRRIEVAINQSKDPDSSLVASLLIASSLIRDITANGVYQASESTLVNSDGLQRTTSINSMDSNISTYSTGNPTAVFKGIGFVEAIHESREESMKDNSCGFESLKNIIDRVGGKISHDFTFIYRKILVKLIGLLQTSLVSSVKELLYESIGYLCVYINDIRDVDDTQIDTIEMFNKLSPGIITKFLSILPKTLESSILNCSISARNSFIKYLLNVVNLTFNILNERLDNEDFIIDIYISVNNWLEFLYKHRNETNNLNDNLKLFNKLIIYYINNDENNLDYYINNIIYYIGLINPNNIKILLNINLIKSKINDFNIYSILKLFNLTWNNSNHINVTVILDILYEIINLSNNNYELIINTISKLETKHLEKNFINLPKSHKVYSKITQFVKLPDNINDDNPPFEIINIFLARQVLLPLIIPISKVYEFKEIKQNNFDTNSLSQYELCLFLLQTKESCKFETVFYKNFKKKLYFYFILQDLSRISLSIDNIDKALELACFINKTSKFIIDKFISLEVLSDEIKSNFRLLIEKIISKIEENGIVLNSVIWDEIKEMSIVTSHLLGVLSSKDNKWEKICNSVINELINKLDDFIKSPNCDNRFDCLIVAHRLLLITMGNNKLDNRILELISKLFNIGEIFNGSDLFNDLFIKYNKCLTFIKHSNVLYYVIVSLNNYTSYVINSLDDKGIISMADSLIYISNYSIKDLSSVFNELLHNYDYLLGAKMALQVHGSALIKLINNLIEHYCIDGVFFTEELILNIAKIIYKCILLVYEYPNTSIELRNSILNLYKILKTQITNNDTDLSTFQLDLEIRFKERLLNERVGILKNIENNETRIVSLEYSLLIFTLQNYYINRKKYYINKFDNQLLEFIRPPYQLIRMVAKDLCNYAGTPEDQRKELSDFIDKYILPMFFIDGGVSRDFCKSIYEFIRIRKPKLERSKPSLKLESVLNGAKTHSKNGTCNFN